MVNVATVVSWMWTLGILVPARASVHRLGLCTVVIVWCWVRVVGHNWGGECGVEKEGWASAATLAWER